MATLLLNASFEPIRVLDTKRAIVLVLQDKAEIVSEGDTEYRSSSVSIAAPSVIRLKYYVQIPYRSKIAISRRGVLSRDNFVCQFVGCNNKATTIDHVMPRSKGGAHAWENVVAACQKCNAKKADKTMEQLGWKLKKQPKAPKAQGWVLIGMKPRPDWEPWLTKATLANV